MYCLRGELELIAVSVSHTPELALLQDQKGGPGERLEESGHKGQHGSAAGQQGTRDTCVQSCF